LDGKAASVHTHAISDVTSLQTTLDGKSGTSHNHNAAYDALGSASAALAAATAADAAHVAASDPHPQYAVIYTHNGSAYVPANGAGIYVDDIDPGSVADGSIWIDPSA
jgi:hypothetical protein